MLLVAAFNDEIDFVRYNFEFYPKVFQDSVFAEAVQGGAKNVFNFLLNEIQIEVCTVEKSLSKFLLASKKSHFKDFLSQLLSRFNHQLKYEHQILIMHQIIKDKNLDILNLLVNTFRMRCNMTILEYAVAYCPTQFLRLLWHAHDTFDVDILFKRAMNSEQFENANYILQQGNVSSDIPFTKKFSVYLHIIKKTRIRAARKIYFWWIPLCYNIDTERGKRMAEKMWQKTQQRYIQFNNV